jgi:hypothetical protein
LNLVWTTMGGIGTFEANASGIPWMYDSETMR